jgi:hypothetical protein
MGKRELLLIVAFAIAGAIVYQANAPPPAPGERSFSPRGIIEHIRRGMRGSRASAESLNTSTHPVETAVTELQIATNPVELTIIGEDRADISAELKVHSNGYDDAEARRTAKETALKIDRDGVRLRATINYPEDGRQTANLTLHVPARLQVKVDSTRGRTRIANVAGIETDSGRGNVEIKEVKGRVAGNYRGGELHVVGAGSVKLTTIGTDVRLEQIAGQTSMNMRAGNLRAAGLVGPIDVDTTGVDVELENLEKTTGMVRITAAAGSISLKGLRTEARIDSRSADVDAIVDRPVPLAIYSEAGGRVEITPPPGGYQLDAVASDGSIDVPGGTVQVTGDLQEHRATGAVNGGGPTITIRTTHGNITVREREGTEKNGGATGEKPTTEKRSY